MSSLRARLYDAECVLHAARQSGIDSWLFAASDGLHDVLVELKFVTSGVDALSPSPQPDEHF